MGSSVKAVNMPNKLRRIMLEAFSHLPYKVLWKWESNTKNMRNIPSHIKLGKWFPQQDILGNIVCHSKIKLKKCCHYNILFTGHKNIKSFVTHGEYQ